MQNREVYATYGTAASFLLYEFREVCNSKSNKSRESCTYTVISVATISSVPNKRTWWIKGVRETLNSKSKYNLERLLQRYVYCKTNSHQISFIRSLHVCYSLCVLRRVIKPEWRKRVLSQLRQRFEAVMTVFKLFLLVFVFASRVFAQDEVFIGKILIRLYGNETSAEFSANFFSKKICI